MLVAMVMASAVVEERKRVLKMSGREREKREGDAVCLY